MTGSDFLTIDAFARPTGGRTRWRRNLRQIVAGGIEGLRGATVNYSNNPTYAVPPPLLRLGGRLASETPRH